MKNFSPVETKLYGTAGAKKRCILLDQHSSAGKDFFEAFPDLRGMVESDESTFNEFINLERDFGADILSRDIAQHVEQNSKEDIEVVLVRSNLPRAIVDTNRVTKKSIRNVIDYSGQREMELLMRDVQFQAITQIREKLALLLHNNGVFVDIHTMAPYTPAVAAHSDTEVMVAEPDNLQEYINAFTSAHVGGTRRYIDIVTALPGLPPIADPRLVNSLKKSFDANKLSYRENDPYPTAPYVMATEYMNHFTGVLIETPKDYLTYYKAEDKNFDLINPNISHQRVNKVAKAIGSAILECINYK